MRLKPQWSGLIRKTRFGYEGVLQDDFGMKYAPGDGYGWWFRFTEKGIEKKLARVKRGLDRKERISSEERVVKL